MIELNARLRDLILLHLETRFLIEASVTELETARLIFSMFLVMPSTKQSRLSDVRRQFETLEWLGMRGEAKYAPYSPREGPKRAHEGFDMCLDVRILGQESIQ